MNPLTNMSSTAPLPPAAHLQLGQQLRLLLRRQRLVPLQQVLLPALVQRGAQRVQFGRRHGCCCCWGLGRVTAQIRSDRGRRQTLPTRGADPYARRWRRRGAARKQHLGGAGSSRQPLGTQSSNSQAPCPRCPGTWVEGEAAAGGGSCSCGGGAPRPAGRRCGPCSGAGGIAASPSPGVQGPSGARRRPGVGSQPVARPGARGGLRTRDLTSPQLLQCRSDVGASLRRGRPTAWCTTLVTVWCAISEFHICCPPPDQFLVIPIQVVWRPEGPSRRVCARSSSGSP